MPRKQIVLCVSLRVLSVAQGEPREGADFSEKLAPLPLPRPPELEHGDACLVFVDVDDGKPCRAIVSPNDLRTYALGIDNLRSLLGPKAFEALTSLATAISPPTAGGEP
jgi:hypothetical protein